MPVKPYTIQEFIPGWLGSLGDMTPVYGGKLNLGPMLSMM